MDRGHKDADRNLKKVEKRLKKEYQQAYKEMQVKTDKWLAKFRAEDQKLYSQLEDGLISYDDYIKWRKANMLAADQLHGISEELTQTITEHNARAAGMVNAHARSVFCSNYNYGAYEVCKGAGLNLSFDLVDEKTVGRLLGDNIKLLPHVEPDKKKDHKWNMQKIQSALTQGIVQGEDINKIAKRLQNVAKMDEGAAVRNARTMTTAAENGGRQAVYEEAEEMGIELQKTWVATLDDRTRASHVELDGETVPVDEKFSNSDGELMYPADPDGDPENVYNCRCTLISSVKGYKPDLQSRVMGKSLGNWSYETWKKDAEERTAARKK